MSCRRAALEIDEEKKPAGCLLGARKTQNSFLQLQGALDRHLCEGCISTGARSCCAMLGMYPGLQGHEEGRVACQVGGASGVLGRSAAGQTRYDDGLPCTVCLLQGLAQRLHAFLLSSKALVCAMRCHLVHCIVICASSTTSPIRALINCLATSALEISLGYLPEQGASSAA